ncbi:RhuM family protein [soil metagenome]
MSKKQNPYHPGSQLLIYQTEDGALKLDVRFEEETVWLAQQDMAELFQTTKQNVSLHIKNIFSEDELREVSVVKESLTTASDGKNYPTKLYNLDVIISVGYRVKSRRGTQFRIWATQRLREYVVKGFILDDERLKNPDQPFDYFEELTRRIQDIRTSERRFYQKITDIYATSIDYDPTQDQSIRFFKTVQNKVHWAITGHTAAEIVHDRVDAAKPNLGLTNWRGASIRKQDVSIAKNYLSEPELAALNNLVEQYLVFADGQAMRRIPVHMKDWIEKLDSFLSLNEREILDHAGRISHEIAQEKAELE